MLVYGKILGCVTGLFSIAIGVYIFWRVAIDILAWSRQKKWIATAAHLEAIVLREVISKKGSYNFPSSDRLFTVEARFTYMADHSPMTGSTFSNPAYLTNLVKEAEQVVHTFRSAPTLIAYYNPEQVNQVVLYRRMSRYSLAVGSAALLWLTVGAALLSAIYYLP